MAENNGANEKNDKSEEKEIHELPFGKQMTSLLIVKDMRKKPKEVLKGVAFLAFICFFLFSFMFRGCQRDEVEQGEQPVGPSSHLSQPSRSA